MEQTGSESWFLLPLLLLMWMSGTKQWGVPILMALLMTHSLTALLPNPIPLLDYNPIVVEPAASRALAAHTLEAGATQQIPEPAFDTIVPPPEPTLAREKAALREHATQFFRALPSLWNARAPAPRTS